MCSCGRKIPTSSSFLISVSDICLIRKKLKTQKVPVIRRPLECSQAVQRLTHMLCFRQNETAGYNKQSWDPSECQAADSGLVFFCHLELKWQENNIFTAAVFRDVDGQITAVGYGYINGQQNASISTYIWVPLLSQNYLAWRSLTLYFCFFNMKQLTI